MEYSHQGCWYGTPGFSRTRHFGSKPMSRLGAFAAVPRFSTCADAAAGVRKSGLIPSGSVKNGVSPLFTVRFAVSPVSGGRRNASGSVVDPLAAAIVFDRMVVSRER